MKKMFRWVSAIHGCEHMYLIGAYCTCSLWGFYCTKNTFICQTGCYTACFVLFLKIIIDLIRRFENNCYTCCNFYRIVISFQQMKKPICFFLWDSISVASVLTVWKKTIVLFHKYCLSEYAVQVHVLFYGPKITTSNSSIRQKASYIGHLEACFSPSKVNNHYLNVLVHYEATTEENHS